MSLDPEKFPNGPDPVTLRVTPEDQFAYMERQEQIRSTFKGVIRAVAKLYGLSETRKALNFVADEVDKDYHQLPYREKWLDL